ncbi:unnamed protein product [Adineta steineri]|uniref:Ig-like domain-containing protein n=1 Tax=Adineta steineri TaxID=433720 RepID=A0A813YN22_9BILA|nr:unnamed protein product [Adineta steineri]CAF1023750.1 unnamed protein product [Adineta steineri]CAF1159541.1 unnamed protein product [Adineta steineri]
MSQIKIPLIPADCLLCQSAYEVDIQLIDEQLIGNRTIQRIKIFLKNFEIEDSSYICLIKICPIIVEYGNDGIFLNITSTLFSHVFLSLIYFNQSILCSIQTRFTIFSNKTSLSCTNEIYLHPRLNNYISTQLKIYNCRANLFFEQNIYQTSIKFQHTNFSTYNQTISIKSLGQICEYILDSTSYLGNISTIEINELLTTVTILPFYNPWKKDIQILGSCGTTFISYQDMFFTNDIVNIRNINVEQGQTIQLHCPINGSHKYLKYTWYYQRYQPKYQISNNRTIILRNITEQMQGKYMCVGDDGNELLEFEMTLHVFTHNKTNKISFHFIIITILFIILILFCIIITLIIYYLLRKSSSIDYSIEKRNSLTIHHDVRVKIQQSSGQQIGNSLWNQVPYHTLDYIDEQPIYHIVSTDNPSNQLPQIPSWSWIKQPTSDKKQIPHRFSIRHRNINGQLPTQLAVNIPSNSNMTVSSIVKFNQISDLINGNITEQCNDMEILKISVPLLNHYPLVKSTSSIISFDSQIELEEFNKMTTVCMDTEL